ncbi:MULTISPECIES: DUF732 domain-containing protein [Pseudonocardia]|nr:MULTISPECIES: DUF732 domain-containing protein [Pseudonocardia]
MALTTARSTGSVETDSATAASPSAVPTAEEAFVADVLDTPGLNSTMTDQAMVGIGRGACDVMAYQEYSREDLVAELGTSKLGPQVAAVMVDAAHRNLCPQYTFPSASSGQSGAPAPVATGPATSVSDGTYEVGADIEAGRYKTDGPIAGARACYQARLSDDSGDSSSIIANDITDGPSSVTIGAGEFVKFSGGCTWTMQGAS